MTDNLWTFDDAEFKQLVEQLEHLTPKEQVLLKAFLGFGIDRLNNHVPGTTTTDVDIRSVEVENPHNAGDWEALFDRAFAPGPTPSGRRTNGGKVGGSGVRFTFHP